MSLRRVALLSIALIVLVLSATSCGNINETIGIPDDNPIEEAIENYILEEADFIIDLTPKTKEKR